MAEAIFLPVQASRPYCRSSRYVWTTDPEEPQPSGTSTGALTETSGAQRTNHRRFVSAPTTYRRNAARVAAAVELKYSGGSMKPHSLNVRPLVRARR